MMPARSTIAAGLFGLLFIMPAAAQTAEPGTGAGDAGVQRGNEVPGIFVTPPRPIPIRPERRDRSEPGRTNDRSEPPPPGCSYRENKLDLLV